MSGYWCYSFWRSLCYSSLCDYYCCCDCAPSSTLLRPSSSGKGVHQHITDKDDDWGIARDEEGRLQVAPDNQRMGRSYIPNVPSSPSSSSSSSSSLASASNHRLGVHSESSSSIKASSQKSLHSATAQLLPSSDRGSPHYGVIRTGDEEDDEEDRDHENDDDDDEDTEITFERKVGLPRPVSPNRNHDATSVILQTPTAAGDRSDSVASDGWQRYRTPSATNTATDSVANSLSTATPLFPSTTPTRSSAAADALAAEESEILKELESAIFHHH